MPFSYQSDCVVREELQYAAETLYPWLTVIVFFYLPMIVIVLCNIGIIRKLISTQNERVKVRYWPVDSFSDATTHLHMKIYLSVERMNGPFLGWSVGWMVLYPFLFIKEIDNFLYLNHWGSPIKR